MATKTVGELIKEARTAAKLSQEALAKQIDGLSASDISKAERGEKELTQAQLKAIAKATGVTQKSLLDAAKGTSSTAAKTSSTTAKKTSSTSSSSAKKTGTTSTAKKTSSSTTSSSGTSVKVTAAEKKLLELYRAADSETKKAAVALLKGEKTDDSGVLGTLLNALGGNDLVSGVLGNLKK